MSDRILHNKTYYGIAGLRSESKTRSKNTHQKQFQFDKCKYKNSTGHFMTHPKMQQLLF